MGFKVIVCAFAILCLLAGSIFEADASPVANVSLQGVGVNINLEFPEEAQPAESVTYNLTMSVSYGLKLTEFSLLVEALVGTTWVEVHKEQMFSVNLWPNFDLERHMQFTIPQNSQEVLRCTMYVLTDKVPSYPETNIFNATYVRTISYDELTADYSSLLADYEALLDSYDGLSTQYGLLNSTYNSLQDTFKSLNSSYSAQKSTYDSLKSSYDTLETSYKALNQTYLLLKAKDDSSGNRDTELNITRAIMYALFMAVVILMAVVVYIKKMKSEPYIVIQKK